MGIVFRQSVKTTLVVFTGALLGAIFVYLRTIPLSLQQQGFSGYVLSQGALVQLFVILGLGPTVQTFIHRYAIHGDERRPVLITICLITPVLVTLLLCLPYFLLQPF